MTPEDKLNALFAAQAAPTRDPVFLAETAARIARRRMWLSVGASVPWAIAGAALLWVIHPTLEPVTEGLSQGLAPAAMALGGAALSLIAGRMVTRRL